MILKGLSEQTVIELSKIKHEPKWMLDFRLRAYEIFKDKPMPSFGPELDIDFNDLIYYSNELEHTDSWQDVPEHIRKTFDKLGIREAERRFLAGLEAQLDSEAIYTKLKKQWKEKGIIFVSTDEAVKEYPELLKKYLSTVIPPNDNKFAALNAALWSGGSFVYVPKGVKVDIPLQAYFRMETKGVAQFERTLIIADEGSYVNYVEGCTAPLYSKTSLHTGVVEIIALPNSHVRYTTIQNWSENVYNLVTQRAHVYKDAFVEWIDGNMGSKITMKYPAVVLKQQGAKGRILSISYAKKGQIQDTGAKAIHLAENTSSTIISKSISNDGETIFRALVASNNKARDSKATIDCDSLLLSHDSKTATYPTLDSSSLTIAHEASVSKISYEDLFYLQTRAISDEEAKALLVLGFIDEFKKELPMEYAVELNKLIRLDMEGSVG